MSESNLVRPGLTTPLKQLLPEIKKKLRGKVTVLDINDVRKAKMPYHEAIIMQLTEAGFENSAELIRQLVNLEIRMNLPKGLKIDKIYGSRSLLDKLATDLQNIENEKFNENYDRVMFLLTKLCSDFSECSRDLYWMVEQLFLIAISEITKFAPAGLQESRIRYFYGNFLSEKTKFYEHGAEQYAIAKYYCIQHENEWTISENNFGMLKQEICEKFYFCLREGAKFFMKTNSDKAIAFVQKSIEIAFESENIDGVADCYLEYGKILLYRKNYKEALPVFFQGLKYSLKSGESSRICESYLHISISFKNLNDVPNAEKYIKLVKTIAYKKNIQLYIAKYHYTHGEIYMHNKEYCVAADEFITAINLFNHLNLSNELNQARCLAAIAMGQEIQIPFTETILSSDKKPFGNNSDLKKLLEWKSTRKPFWKIEDDEKDKLPIDIKTESDDDDSKVKNIYDYDFITSQNAIIPGTYLTGILNQIAEIKGETDLNKIRGADELKKKRKRFERTSNLGLLPLRDFSI